MSSLPLQHPVSFKKMFKVTPSRVHLLLIVILLLVVWLGYLSSPSHGRSIAIKNRVGGDLTVVIDFDKAIKKEAKKEVEKTPKVDETTKEIAAQVNSVINSKEAEKISESLLTFANEVKQVSRTIQSESVNKNNNNIVQD